MIDELLQFCRPDKRMFKNIPERVFPSFFKANHVKAIYKMRTPCSDEVLDKLILLEKCFDESPVYYNTVLDTFHCDNCDLDIGNIERLEIKMITPHNVKHEVLGWEERNILPKHWVDFFNFENTLSQKVPGTSINSFMLRGKLISNRGFWIDYDGEHAGLEHKGIIPVENLKTEMAKLMFTVMQVKNSVTFDLPKSNFEFLDKRLTDWHERCEEFKDNKLLHEIKKWGYDPRVCKDGLQIEYFTNNSDPYRSSFAQIIKGKNENIDSFVERVVEPEIFEFIINRNLILPTFDNVQIEAFTL